MKDNQNYCEKDFRLKLYHSPSSANKPLLLQLGAQEYTYELIFGDNVDLSKPDVTEPRETWVVTCYTGKYCPSNVTTIPQIRWYLYSKLKCEFNQLLPTQAALNYKIFRSNNVTLEELAKSLLSNNEPPFGTGSWLGSKRRRLCANYDR